MLFIWKATTRWVQKHILSSIERKLAVAFMIVVLLPLLGTGLYGNWITSKILTERGIEAATADLEVRASRIESYLAGIRGDLFYLSEMDLLHDLLAGREKGDARLIADLRNTLGTQFALFARTHPQYYQIRYIAEDGQEFVRVNARYGFVEIVPQSGLQWKYRRYYFQETMRLGKGEVYMSPVDLNREYGRLEIPYTPVVRYATPLFFPSGRRAGILILNLYADEFLRFVYEGRHRQEMVLVDQDGYYMVHPNPAKTWGHPWDRGTGHRLHIDYPRHWPELLAPQTGVVTTLSEVIVHMPIFPDTTNPERYWVLLHIQPKSRALAPVLTFRLTAGGILMLAILVSLFMATILAHDISAPLRLLTERVRRLGRGEHVPPLPITSNDEVGELARAFEEMEAALRQHMERLARLDIAGRRIMGHLDRERIFEAVAEALDMLFDAPCKVVRSTQGQGGEKGEKLLVCIGERTFLPENAQEAQEARRAAEKDGVWHPARIPMSDGTLIYMCCAPMQSASRHYGWLELYGPHADVINPTVGNLLTSLAMQVAAALENADLYHRLEAHRERLRTLVEQLISVQEEERRMVAYDIHDGLIQRLVGARLHLLSLIEGDGFQGSDRRVLERAIEHVGAAIAEARRTIEGLRPPLLDELGLIPALTQYAQELNRQGDWEIHLDTPAHLERLPDSIEITAFRIAQEALNNIRKYAQARHVYVRVQRDGNTLILEIQDDGVGFDIEEARAKKQCVGLTSMQERAALVGGHCIIHSRPGQGTTVRALLPVSLE